MRTYKFRAWDNVEKCWVKSFSIPNIGWQKIEGEPMTDIEIMQYTGLKDKNGKEVYEGDIIKNKHDQITKVQWYEENYCFLPMSIDSCDDSNWGDISKYEIIGNIFETPNLLNNE